eukprot:GHVS01059267.1.p1 GENE.GHVS01059267.1~~GHVS01059267.1.p1  ORF type:complete len:1060 (+),score=121.55 GHVS01059267.1:479-3181(+)
MAFKFYIDADQSLVRWGDGEPVFTEPGPTNQSGTTNQSLDAYAAGVWVGTCLRGNALPDKVVMGFMYDEQCFITIFYDATIDSNGEIVGGEGDAFCSMIGPSPKPEDVVPFTVGTDGKALSRMLKATKQSECKKVMKAAYRGRASLFNRSIRNDDNFGPTLDRPYSLETLKTLADQVNEIDVLCDKLKSFYSNISRSSSTVGIDRSHTDLATTAFGLITKINKVKATLNLLSRLTTVAANAYQQLTASDFVQYVQDKVDKGLIMDKLDCTKWLAPPADQLATGDRLAPTMTLVGACSSLLGQENVREHTILLLTKASVLADRCSNKMTIALKELYVAATHVTALVMKVCKLHEAAKCLWGVGQMPTSENLVVMRTPEITRRWVYKQLAAIEQPADVTTGAMHYMWKETADLYTDPSLEKQLSVAKWGKAVECAKQLQTALHQLKLGKNEELGWMESLCTDVDDGIYTETLNLLSRQVEEFNQPVVVNADKCAQAMTTALQALTAAGDVKDSILETRLSDLHVAAGCLYQQTSKGRSLVNSKLVALPPYRSVKHDAIHYIVREATTLYIGGCTQSKDEWVRTAKCGSLLIAASKRVRMVTKDNLKKGNKDLEWMESQLCPDVVGDGIYRHSSRLILQDFRRRILTEAADMVGIKEGKWFGDITYKLDTTLEKWSDFVRTSIALYSTAAHDDDESKRSLRQLKSIASIWATSPKLLHRFQLIGWSLLWGYTTTVASHKKQQGVDTIITAPAAAEGEKEKEVDALTAAGAMALEVCADKSVVHQFSTLRTRLLGVEKEWKNDLAKTCYAEMLTGVADGVTLMADVVEACLLTTTGDVKNMVAWAEQSKEKCGKELRKQILTDVRGRVMRNNLRTRVDNILAGDDYFVCVPQLTELWKLIKGNS